jgi:sugar lactone lactonase YvrE
LGTIRTVLTAVTLSLAWPATAQDTIQLAADDRDPACTSGDGLAAICGPAGVEDLVALPGQRWLAGSGLNFGTPTHLVLIDSHTHRFHRAYPDGGVIAPLAADSDCSAPPDEAGFSFSGLALVQHDAHQWRLLAVNHGDRKAVEFFRVTGLPDAPHLAWEGCALLPADSDPNGVAALPDGRLMVSDFRGPEPDAAWGLLEQGLPVGSLMIWQSGHGITERASSNLSGPNGLAVSPDGEALYVSDWGGRRLVLRDLASGAERALPLDFLPDNIDVLPDGRLLVAGQAARPAAIGGCTGAACPQPWLIALVDPARGTVTPLVEHGGTVQASYATSAAQVGDMLFITVRGMDRVLLAPAP